MTKYGVGVGEDLPVDENKPEPLGNDRENPRCGQRGGYNAWQRFRERTRTECHGPRRSFRRGFSQQEAVEALDDLRSQYLHRLALGGLALIGVAAFLALLNTRR